MIASFTKDIQERASKLKPIRHKFKKHKYNASPRVVNGIRFDSTKEADYYLSLKLRNDVLFFLRQVPFHLPGGVVLRIDFQVFLKDGTVEFVEVKGFETATWKIKKKLAEAEYPITIKVV